MSLQIPRRIIQTGKRREQPLRNQAMMANLRLLNPDYEYLFFDDEGVQSFIDHEYPEYRGVFDSFSAPIQRYDFFRYLAIFHYGGFYFDLDMMLATGLSSLLQYGCVFSFEGLTFSRFLRSHYGMDWEIGNYAFGAAPGHPFLRAVIDNCVRAQQDPAWVEPMMRGVPGLSRADFHVLNTTGPGLVSRTLAEDTEVGKLVTVLFPNDVCDFRNWNRFGDLGVHMMEGSWRPRRSRLSNRLAQRWESAKLNALLRESATLGKRRRHITLEGPETKRETQSLRHPKRPQEPLVSILIPAFNAEKYIAGTIRSAIGQTWKSKEVIVVDDGSKDRTLEIARQFESDTVRIVTQKQQGAAAARNKAFSLSKGEYIQWLDADDLLSPDKIALQMKAAQEADDKRVLLSSGWGSFICRHQKAKFVPSALWADLTTSEWLFHKLDKNIFLQTACWLVSRELTDAVGPWDSRLLGDDDGEYFGRVVLASKGVKFVPEAKVYYRGPAVAFRSLSYIGESDRQVRALWLSMQLHMRYLRSVEDSERTRGACLNFIRTSLSYFYPDWPEIVAQAKEIAHGMGEELAIPRMSWKYEWIRKMFGWRAAKLVQRLLLSVRWTGAKLYEQSVSYMEDAAKRLPQTGLQIAGKLRGKYQRFAVSHFCRRAITIKPSDPIISFTFDDFPRSALSRGGEILRSKGVLGTYYVSLGLAGKQIETGPMFLMEDLKAALEQGHELGCHTFSHCHAWETDPNLFESEILENQRTLAQMIPGVCFKTLSFPIGQPRIQTKVRASRHFSCCRGGGQTFNIGEADLNCLSAYFLEQSRDNPEAIKRVIDENSNAGGWLIFATHDVSDDPTKWGCTPDLFEDIVQYAVDSGARILPVVQAYESLLER